MYLPINQIVEGDCLAVMRTFPEDSIDTLITDPPYGYSFMGLDWDKAVPSVEVWKECLRVLKPGAFMCVMSAPRSDVLSRMVVNIEQAGFRVDFTPMYWTYANGFPKAANIKTLVDKKLAAIRSTLTEAEGSAHNNIVSAAKKLEGSYAGFQPKPAVEVIIVAMKSLREGTHIGQALANGKGISWLDDGRIPAHERVSRDRPSGHYEHRRNPAGRFPANLLISDDVLGELYSQFFTLDKWAATLPFLVVPKARQEEKDQGLDEFEEKKKWPKVATGSGISFHQNVVAKNIHPTVKPLKLMSYLVTLFSRSSGIVLDPFVGSGTTVLAAHELSRDWIGIEREPDYANIARARVASGTQQQRLDMVA